MTTAEVIEIINARIRKMREVYTSEPGGDPEEVWMGHAFHLMELRNILEGKYTCGVYDDFGPPDGKKAGDLQAAAPHGRQEPEHSSLRFQKEPAGSGNTGRSRL